MGSRPFAQIDGSLLNSQKLRRCRKNDSRWAYICVHLSEQGNYIGFFRYRLVVWAEDAHLSKEALVEAIKDLIDCGLIEYDFEEESVRVIAWFYKRNAPENASRMQSYVADFAALGDESVDMKLRAVAEFIVGSVRRAQRWKVESPEWEKLRDTFRPFMRQMHAGYGEAFLGALGNEIENNGEATRAEIYSLLPQLDPTLRARSQHPAKTVTAHETKMKQDGYEEDTNKKTETNTGDPSEKNAEEASEAMNGKELPLDEKTEAYSRPREATKLSRLAQQAMKGTKREW